MVEVFIGLLVGDPESYINECNSRPHLPGAHSGDFTMSDLLTFTDAPITQRDVELAIGDVHTRFAAGRFENEMACLKEP